LLLLTSGLSCLFAQPPPDQGQFRQVPGFGYGTFNVHQNTEIGVLEPAQYAAEPDMFQVYTTQTYYHTDNALLTPNPQEANAWIGDKIVGTGYFGSTRSEAAERLLGEAIRSLLREGVLVQKKPKDL
jgi:hypothetical protein